MKFAELQEKAQEFKETVWAFLDEHKIGGIEERDVKQKVNETLDEIDELPFRD